MGWQRCECQKKQAEAHVYQATHWEGKIMHSLRACLPGLGMKCKHSFPSVPDQGAVSGKWILCAFLCSHQHVQGADRFLEVLWGKRSKEHWTDPGFLLFSGLCLQLQLDQVIWFWQGGVLDYGTGLSSAKTTMVAGQVQARAGGRRGCAATAQPSRKCGAEITRGDH